MPLNSSEPELWAWPDIGSVQGVGQLVWVSQGPMESDVGTSGVIIASGMNWTLLLSYALQVLASVILFGLGAGWLAGACNRCWALERIKRAKIKQVAQETELPGVSLVMPVKGCRYGSDINWATLMQTAYGGFIEFIFVVESEEDPAHKALQQVVDVHDARNARVVVAGLATTCSQKIHNLLAGIRSCSRRDSSYVFCLDDDISLHPQSVAMLVQEMEDNPDLFLVTGYPFDVPAPGSGLLSYCVMVFHLPLLIAFSISQRVHNVWGGCMLFRLKQLLEDKYHILQDWEEGGYSDDLIVASKCSQFGLKVGAPFYAVFPQRLPPRVSWRRYWNYLRRQLYVCDTYVSPINRVINHSMLVVHCVISTVLLLGTILVLVEGARLLHWWVKGQDEMLPAGHAVQSVSLAAVHLQKHPPHWMPVVVFGSCLAFAQITLMLMTGVVLCMFRVLSPHSPAIQMSHFSWFHVWLAIMVESAVLPVCTLYTIARPHVQWGDARYYRKWGKVVRVEWCTGSPQQPLLARENSLSVPLPLGSPSV